MEAVTRSMECSINRTHQNLKRGLSALATIGSTAPFVGLFGTVFGLINGLRGMGERFTVIRFIAGWIAEALISTGLGLLVAVPCVWAFNYFTSKLEGFDVEMNNTADEISTYLSGFRATQRTRSSKS
jgi:biopolymer transport protein ExbB/TolQ